MTIFVSFTHNNQFLRVKNVIPLLAPYSFFLQNEKSFDFKHILFTKCLGIRYCFWCIWERTFQGTILYFFIGTINQHFLICILFELSLLRGRKKKSPLGTNNYFLYIVALLLLKQLLFFTFIELGQWPTVYASNLWMFIDKIVKCGHTYQYSLNSIIIKNN